MWMAATLTVRSSKAPVYSSPNELYDEDCSLSAAAFCPVFPPPTGIVLFFIFLTIYLFGCVGS